GRNIYGDDPRPAFDVTIEDVVRRDPDVVLVGPESAVRMKALPAWRALRAVREGRILVFDTVLVGRPGVKLGEAAVSIARLLHPDLVRGYRPPRAWRSGRRSSSPSWWRWSPASASDPCA